MNIKRVNCLKLIELIDRLKDNIFNIETQYKMLLINKQCKEVKELYNEQLQIIINKYAEKNEQGKYIYNKNGGIKIDKEYNQECLQKITELEDSETIFPDIRFTFDELDDLKLTLRELELLEPFIKI